MTTRPWSLLALPLLLVAAGGWRTLWAEEGRPRERGTELKPPDQTGQERTREDRTREEGKSEEDKSEKPMAEEPRAPEKAEGADLPHDGVAAESQEFTYEVAFHTWGAEVYIMDQKGAPVPLSGVSGRLEMSVAEPGRMLLSAPLVPTLEERVGPVQAAPPSRAGEPLQGGRQPEQARQPQQQPLLAQALRADLPLDGIAQGGATATIELSGLPGRGEKQARFQAQFRIARITQRVCTICFFSPREGNLCPSCKAPLVEQRALFVCPKHAEIASDRSGATCWRCNGAPLKLKVERAGAAQGIQ